MTQALREEIRAFLARELPTLSTAQRAQSWNTFDAEFSRKLGKRGWIGMTWPKGYGGSERSQEERYAVLEELLVAGAPLAAHFVAERQSGNLLLKFGSEAQRREILPRIAAGECFFCIGMSEPDAGSDLSAVSTRAEPTDGGWLINGTKLWTTYAHKAHYMILFCRTRPATDKRHEGTSQFLLPMDTAGVTVSPISDMSGGRHFNEVALDNVFVPGTALIGTEGEGWKQVMSELSYERSGPERFLSSMTLLQEFVHVCRSRPIEGEVQAVGRLAAQLTALRCMSRTVAGKLAAGDDPSLDACIVKDLGTCFEQSIPEVVRQHRPIPEGAKEVQSFKDAYEATLLNSPSFSIRGGTREIIRGIIARQLLAR